MAVVQIPTFTALHEAKEAAADKLTVARLAVDALWLLDLAREIGAIEDRLRATDFTLKSESGVSLIATVPD